MQKRKNHRPAATQRPQQQPQKRTVAADGVYNNPIFIHAVSSQLGNTVHLQTKSGAIYEGIFTTFSPQFNVLLEMAHRVEKDNENINVDTVVEKFIFKPSDIVSMVAKDVDPEFATRDTFEIDTAISSRYNGSHMDQKPLERWDSAGDSPDNMCLELDSNANGWDADEMFQKNEAMYGVQSTFDHSLAGYTIQIQKSDSHDFRKAELEAEKIAREIENQTLYDERADLENGDEEAAFAAVVRPQGQSPHTFGGNNGSGNSGSKGAVVSNASQKYVPPAKRKQGQQMGKLITPQTPPAPPGNSQPTTPQPDSTPPPPPTTTQQLPPQPPPQQQHPPPLLHGPPKGHPGKGYNAGPNHNNNPSNAYAPNPNVHNSVASNNYNNQQSTQQQGPGGPAMNGDNGNMQQQQQQQQQQQHPSVVVPAQNQPSMVHVPNNNNQSNHNPHPSAGMGPNNNNKSHGPPRHRGYGQHQQQQQQHLPPNMSMPPHSPYGAEPPQMGPPPPQSAIMQQPPQQIVLKGQPQHIMLMPQPPGQVLLVQSIAPPGGPKMMNPLQQRPPRGREETVQDLKNFQDSYVLAQNSPSPGLSGPPPQQPPPMMYAPPPPNATQQQPPTVATQQQQQQQEDMKSQGGVPSSPQPTSLPPPIVSAHHQGQRPGTTPSPAGNGNNGSAGGSTPVRPADIGSVGVGGAAASAEKQPAEAKKSVLNPLAKSFTPRSSSTPTPSRPQTPQSAGPQMVQGPMPSMPGAPNGGSGGQPPHQQKFLLQKQYAPRGVQFGLPASAVQAATGQPITLPYMYPPHQQHFAPAQQPYSMIRMFPSDAPQPMQFLAASPHQQTPSPAAQYHPQPPPAGGGPSQPFSQAAGQQTIIYTNMHTPQMIGHFHPNAQQAQYPSPFTLFQHNPNQ